MGTREDITRAIIAGREAGARGDSPTVCPHSRESLLRVAWIRGYAEKAPKTKAPWGM
ncbi:Rmf/CrpP fold protein [Streptomyces sp. Isolate_219]|uniref:Rmf/CrpP fold protein n=1 Tax=Streptomyces sp. Isolate_219 TaxID=2950110 RepID=UPI0021C8EBFB|nr:Rmf/CrpP fold protein [Streptomyces sp. Isolate_219]MCR8576166.1 hypothetical protein [Streptomyces sp. Isolate_219]